MIKQTINKIAQFSCRYIVFFAISITSIQVIFQNQKPKSLIILLCFFLAIILARIVFIKISKLKKIFLATLQYLSPSRTFSIGITKIEYFIISVFVVELAFEKTPAIFGAIVGLSVLFFKDLFDNKIHNITFRCIIVFLAVISAFLLVMVRYNYGFSLPILLFSGAILTLTEYLSLKIKHFPEPTLFIISVSLWISFLTMSVT